MSLYIQSSGAYKSKNNLDIDQNLIGVIIILCNPLNILPSKTLTFFNK